MIGTSFMKELKFYRTEPKVTDRMFSCFSHVSQCFKKFYKGLKVLMIFPEILTERKMKLQIKILFSKWDQIYSFLRILSHLQKKSLMKNSFVYAVNVNNKQIKKQEKEKERLCKKGIINEENKVPNTICMIFCCSFDTWNVRETYYRFRVWPD